MGNPTVEMIKRGDFKEPFRLLYGEEGRAPQENRYAALLSRYEEFFGGSRGALHLFSVPGRSEVGGNHTDHNHGRVLACSVDLDIIAAAAAADDGRIIIKSEGFEPDSVSLSDLRPHEDEKGHSAALIRGVCARLMAMGYHVGGLKAYTTSNVLKGSGLSSSAAFEVMVANIINHLYNGGKITPMEMAMAAQYAENEYFGKPSGLMDQTACAVGGFVAIDFRDVSAPVLEPVRFDFASTKHSLCIIDTAGNHADLTEDYAAIRGDMSAAANALGAGFLRDCSEKEFYARLPSLRGRISDRAILRAMHFFNEDARVEKMTAALKAGDFERFKSLVIESGRSSFMYLQNCYSIKSPCQQGVPLALALCEKLLSGRGAWRVHGGGFAGTVQAFVPDDILKGFVSAMNGVFGENATYVLRIRPAGAYRIF